MTGLLNRFFGIQQQNLKVDLSCLTKDLTSELIKEEKLHIPILLLLNKADLFQDTETINSRIKEIKALYDADNRKVESDAFITVNDSFFKKSIDCYFRKGFFG